MMFADHSQGDGYVPLGYMLRWRKPAAAPSKHAPPSGWPAAAVPVYDAAAMRRHLYSLCDPLDLLAYMEQRFAHTAQPCTHTFALVDAYFAADLQQACAIYQLLESLGVACDCEAFFVLRTLTD